MTESPTSAAADLLIRQAPATRHVAEQRRWINPDGTTDWDLVTQDLPHLGYLSGAEQRVLRFALALHDAEVWGLDDQNAQACADALRTAADGFQSLADDIRAVMARLTLAGMAGQSV